jgi:hypothetical protein
MIHHKTLSAKLSVKNCMIISFFDAQMAFLIQISFVLSVTETSIIFITQIHHTKREIQAIHHNNIVNIEVIEVIFSSISLWFLIL